MKQKQTQKDIKWPCHDHPKKKRERVTDAHHLANIRLFVFIARKRVCWSPSTLCLGVRGINTNHSLSPA